MAPIHVHKPSVNYHHPPSTTMAPVASKLAPSSATAVTNHLKLEPVTLGREVNKTTIRVAICPDSSTKPSLKARAFMLTKSAIARHLHKYNFAELADRLVHTIPGDHSFTSEQVDKLDTTLEHQPYTINNLTLVGFVTSDFRLLPNDLLLADPSERPANVHYLRVLFKVDFRKLALS